MKNKMIILLLCSLFAMLPLAANAVSASSDITPCFIFDDLYDVY